MEGTSQPNPKQIKRQWTSFEDAKLVECLVELTTTSWKCDNGTFKSGYARQLEKMLCERIPECDLRASSHIESRVKLLKKHYFAIVEMVGAAGSGFGWNDKNKMIVVEKQIFDEWKSSHPNANGLFNKPFQHFEELGVVFGKDRAQGGNVENIAQAIANMEVEREANLSDLQINVNTQVNLDETETEFEADSQEPPTPGVAAPNAPSASDAPSSWSARQRNKRKRASTSEEIVDTIVESINEIKTAYQQQSSVLVDIVACFKHEQEVAERKMKLEQEVAERKMKLMALLRDVPELSVEKRMKAALNIAKDNNLIDMVFQLQSEEMLPFLKTLL